MMIFSKSLQKDLADIEKSMRLFNELGKVNTNRFFYLEYIKKPKTSFNLTEFNL